MFSSRQPRSRRSRLRDLIWPRIGLRRSWQYLMYRLARVKLSPHRLALGFATGAFASFTQDGAEGVASFREKRPARYENR